MKLEIQVSNKQLLGLIIVLVIVASISYVYSQAPNPGHSWSQIGGIPAGFADSVDNDMLGGIYCTEGQTLKVSGGNWVCSYDYDLLSSISCANNQLLKYNNLPCSGDHECPVGIPCIDGFCQPRGWSCADIWPQYISGGLYGNCRHRYHGYCDSFSPAQCNPLGGGSGSYCECPSGFIRVWTGSSGDYTNTNTWNFFSCYKS